MSFEIEWHPSVRRFLRKLHPQVSKRIVEKIKSLQENPFRFLEHYEGDDYYKLRIGDYRALVDVDFKNKILIIQVLDKRSRIYKR